jgi:hypothetical protein
MPVIKGAEVPYTGSSQQRKTDISVYLPLFRVRASNFYLNPREVVLRQCSSVLSITNRTECHHCVLVIARSTI